MENQEIRKAAQNSGVRLWQIAHELGLADCNFSRKLRFPLPETEKKQILDIIARLKTERGNACG